MMAHAQKPDFVFWAKRTSPFNLLAPEFYMQILAHSVCKMWIIQEPKKVALWNKRHFEEKNGECAACLKYSVLTFVEKKNIKCNIWRVAVRPSYIWDARFLKVNSAGASVQSITGSRGVRISGSNAGYTIFRCSVKSTGYPLHSPVSPSLHLPCLTVCHHISTALYFKEKVGRVAQSV